MIALRLGREADAAAVARVHVESWHRAYDAITPRTMREAVAVEPRTRMWRALLSDYRETHPTIVAETDAGEIVGFAMGGPADAAAGGFAAEFHAIFLTPAYQRRDCGRRLFIQLAGRLAARGCGTATATVLHTPQAAGFFRAMAGVEAARQDLSLSPSADGATLVQDIFAWYDLSVFSTLSENPEE